MKDFERMVAWGLQFRHWGRVGVLALLLGLAGCSSVPKTDSGSASGAGSTASSGSGRYYLDDGPGERPLSELETLPDAIPRAEALHRGANRPYVVFGRSYQPMTELKPFRERGMATWYGRRYHDRPTSIGERYDMYAMTAAHTRLPLPSYARVTNLKNGRTVIVRVNDRGPFLHGRVIDLSYAAAARLGFARSGSAEVEVELITDVDAYERSAANPSSPEPRGPAAKVAEPVVIAQTLPPPAPPAALRLEPAAPPVPVAQPVSRTPPPNPAVPWTTRTPHVQLGAYRTQDNAEAALRGLEPRLRDLGLTLSVRSEGGVHRLVAGPFNRAEQAAQVAREIRAMTGLETLVRPR
jgi:rare lipoprotein A